jgi:hypothetical protein
LLGLKLGLVLTTPLYSLILVKRGKINQNTFFYRKRRRAALHYIKKKNRVKNPKYNTHPYLYLIRYICAGKERKSDLAPTTNQLTTWAGAVK